MEYFLIFMSFLLHIVTFIALRHYYLKQQSYQSEQQKFQQEKKELEQLLMSYLIEMKEENDRLVDMVQNIPRRDHSSSVQRKLDTNNFDQADKDKTKSPVKETEPGGHTTYTPLVDGIEDEPVAYEKSYQAEIIERYERGESPEEIAKAMDRGKTEIALVIKFHKK